jgi:transcriptional antiterminator NusG
MNENVIGKDDPIEEQPVAAPGDETVHVESNGEFQTETPPELQSNVETGMTAVAEFTGLEQATIEPAMAEQVVEQVAEQPAEQPDQLTEASPMTEVVDAQAEAVMGELEPEATQPVDRVDDEMDDEIQAMPESSDAPAAVELAEAAPPSEPTPLEEEEFVIPATRKRGKSKQPKEPKAKAPRKSTQRAPTYLPDLGDGSGYEAPEPGEGTPEGDEAHWYVVHCYSGYENKVKHNLEQRIETMGMAGKILEVVVPTEDEIEVRDGKRRTVEKRVFPGYVLVNMKMSEESWHVVRNTPGVTRFVGMGNRPQPLSPQEVNQILRRMESDAPKIKVSFRSGQKVRITDGPFADFMGLVDKIDMERAKVSVLVSFFGRETPVELDFLQVERM